MTMKTMAKQLQEFYLDWVNNYLTVDKIAEHNDLTAADARILIELGMAYHQEKIEAACLMLKHKSNIVVIKATETSALETVTYRGIDTSNTCDEKIAIDRHNKQQTDGASNGTL